MGQKARDENRKANELAQIRKRRFEVRFLARPSRDGSRSTGEAQAEASKKAEREADDSDPVMEDLLAKVRTGTPTRATRRNRDREREREKGRERVSSTHGGDVGGAAAKMLALIKGDGAGGVGGTKLRNELVAEGVRAFPLERVTGGELTGEAV